MNLVHTFFVHFEETLGAARVASVCEDPAVMSAVTSTSKMEPVLYREGMLFKRQRGLKTGNAKKLKFQERFCKLTCTSLDYYDPNPKKRVSICGGLMV